MTSAISASRPSLVERAQKLYPAIAERVPQVEEHRHVHDDSIAELIDAGLTRAFQSSIYGGEEANPADFYGAVAEIARACTSTGWILMVLGVHTWEMAHMSRELNDEIFGDDPTTLISSSYNMQGNVATRVPGGFRLSGSWKSSSGIHHAKWVALGATVPGETAAFNFVVPVKDVKVVDDWYVLGLVGTGSRSVVVDDVFVPDHRAIDRDVLRSGFGPGLKDNQAPLYRVQQGLIYTSVSSAPALGAGWRFYEEFKSAFSKSTTVSRTLDGDRLMLTRLAEARGNLSVASTVPQRRLQEGYEAAVAGRQMGDLEVMQAIYDISRNGKLMLENAANLFPTLRPNAVYQSSVMSRLYRDLLVARNHGTANLDERGEALAMTDLGLPGSITLFLPPERREAARERAEALGYL
jgi:3-hydroxy-9,10-secoandrosta-1,3,5(10)-triene-9,17-dione monooxygenase